MTSCSGLATSGVVAVSKKPDPNLGQDTYIVKEKNGAETAHYVEPRVIEKIVYKSTKKAKAFNSSLIITWLISMGFGYSLLERHVHFNGMHLSVDYEMTPGEKEWLCKGFRVVGLNIEGC